ncbi:MAG: glycosyltransferase [Myxococcaceae bacterium]|nr:glycosyltransferase [Myxococcaceae bacterium]
MQDSVSIVMPAYNAAAHLRLVIPAALRALRGGRLLVVDPGSSDGTAELARELGAEVLELGRRAGPAEARNVGTALIESEICLFIDSDCVVHDDAVDRVRAAFSREAELVSITGSYDDCPPAQNFFSQYMNLRHHFVHQHARREGPTFWAGCGAVRVSAFRRAGEFDAERYPMPMIEDVELGLRLHALGRMRLDPELRVTHLKRWTGWNLVSTEIFSRAVPWSQVILSTGQLPNDLNLAWPQRIAAALAPLVLAAAAALPIGIFFRSAGTTLTACVVLVAALFLHGPLVRFFARKRGIFFALGALLFHQVHLIYSAATLAYQAALHGARRLLRRLWVRAA